MTMLGKKHSEESKKKMSEKASLRIGIRNQFFGKKHTKEAKEKQRLRKLDNPTRYWEGKKRPEISKLLKEKWRSTHEEASYITKHDRIRKMWGTPRLCELCDTTEAKIYDWANKDHKYKVVREDWQRLCRTCHIKWDKKHNGYNTHTIKRNIKISKRMKEIWKRRKAKILEIKSKMSK